MFLLKAAFLASVFNGCAGTTYALKKALPFKHTKTRRERNEPREFCGFFSAIHANDGGVSDFRVCQEYALKLGGGY